MEPRSKRLVRWSAIVAVGGALAVAGIANAIDRPHAGHGFGGMGFGPMGGLMRDLKLSDDQKGQLRTITRTGWEQSADERAALDAIRKQIEATVKTNGFDEAQVRALVNTGTPVMAELMVDMVRGLTEMRAVLTPEQQQTFDARRAEFEAKREERRGYRDGAGPGAGPDELT